MPNYQDTRYDAIAGQLIASGIGTNLPYVNAEEGNVSTNIANINSLSPKIRDVFIRDTRVFGNPLDPYVTRYYGRFGVGMEQAVFDPAVNKKLDGTCMPWGNPDIVSQTNYANFAYDIDVSVRDHEIDGAVLDEGQLGSYVAAKLRTPLARLATMKYRTWVQLLSDVIDGTRTVTSNTASDASGTEVQYNPNIRGYAGAVENIGIEIPAVERGSLVTIPSVANALTIAQTLEGRAADFGIPADDDNKLKAETFSTGTPLLIMERKVLNGLDAVFVNSEAASSASVYGYSFRDFVRRFSELVEIDSFASLPTNETYTNARLGAVLIDRDSLIERVQYEDVESFRCAKERATGYSYQGMSTLSIAEMLNSYAMLFTTQA